MRQISCFTATLQNSKESNSTLTQCIQYMRGCCISRAITSFVIGKKIVKLFLYVYLYIYIQQTTIASPLFVTDRLPAMTR